MRLGQQSTTPVSRPHQHVPDRVGPDRRLDHVRDRSPGRSRDTPDGCRVEHVTSVQSAPVQQLAYVESSSLRLNGPASSGGAWPVEDRLLVEGIEHHPERDGEEIHRRATLPDRQHEPAAGSQRPGQVERRQRRGRRRTSPRTARCTTSNRAGAEVVVTARRPPATRWRAGLAVPGRGDHGRRDVGAARAVSSSPPSHPASGATASAARPWSIRRRTRHRAPLIRARRAAASKSASETGCNWLPTRRSLPATGRPHLIPLRLGHGTSSGNSP